MCVFVDERLPVPPALLAAYTDYLERMFDASDDLTLVDRIPLDASASVREWCDDIPF